MKDSKEMTYPAPSAVRAKMKTKDLVMTGMFTAIICVLSQISITDTADSIYTGTIRDIFNRCSTAS